MDEASVAESQLAQDCVFPLLSTQLKPDNIGFMSNGDVVCILHTL